jgi:hypothetical protein
MFGFFKPKEPPFVSFCRDVSVGKQSPKKQGSIIGNATSFLIVFSCIATLPVIDSLKTQKEIKEKFEKCDYDLVVVLCVSLILALRALESESSKFEAQWPAATKKIIREAISNAPRDFTKLFNSISGRSRSVPLDEEMFSNMVAQIQGMGIAGALSKGSGELATSIMSLATDKTFDVNFNFVFPISIQRLALAWSEDETLGGLCRLVEDPNFR